MKTKEQKQNEAAERQTRYDALTTEQKIDQCMTRRGNSERELNRVLQRRLSETRYARNVWDGKAVAGGTFERGE